MSTEQDLQTSLDAIQADVTLAVAKFAALQQTIADLTAQVAAGSPVSQAQLDGLAAEAQAIDAALKPLTA